MKMWCIYVTCLAVLHLCVFTQVSVSEEIQCVVSDTNNNSITCNNCSDHRKLDALSDVVNESNTKVIFCDNFYTLAQSIKVENKSKISLRGVEENGTTIQCMGMMGFSFINVTDLTITGLTFIACGEIFDSTSLNITTNTSTLKFMASIYMYSCTNIKIERVNVVDSDGTGIAIFDTDGNIEMISSTFNNNRRSDSILPGGGGVYVEFTFCPPGKVDDDCIHHQRKNHNSSYLFHDCIFTQNNGTTVFTEHTSYYKAEGTQFHGLGRGGGLCVIFKGDASNNKLTIDACQFTQNGAIWGGGLYVAFHDSPQKNTLLVENTRFIKNDCYLNGGGGVDVGLLFYKELPPERNTMKFNNCSFIENKAKYGGGIKFYSSESKSVNLSNNIEFNDCLWERNMAQYGSAVDISPHVWDTLAGGYLPTPTFENCNFTWNYALHVLMDEGPVVTYKNRGKGAFLCTGLSIHFIGTTTFHGNNGTAMYMSSSSVYFKEQSFVQFEGNTGFEGGAVTLLGFSVLYVMNNSTLKFINNTADSFGGAILYRSNNKHDFSSSRSCFIQYAGTTESVSNRSITFIFSGNEAGKGDESVFGQSIFTTTLRPCRRGCYNEDQQVESCGNNHTEENAGFSCVGNFTFSDNREKEVSTSGAKFKWKNDTFEPVLVSPGQDLVLPFKLMDDLCHKTFGLYHVTIINSNIEQKYINESIMLDPANSYMSDDTVRLFGNPGDVATLELATTGFREISLSITVKIQHCQPGYVVNSTNKRIDCVCSTNTQNRYFGIEHCDETEKRAYIGRGYWTGYKKDFVETESTLESGYCPHAFCHVNNHLHLSTEYPLPHSPSRDILDQDICGSTRTDKLCGNCRSKHSTFFHSINYKCLLNQYCKFGILLYVLSELVPVTVLFLIIIIFKIQLTSGAINGFILFIQLIDMMIIDANGYIQTKFGILIFIKAYRFMYRMFNLEFFTLDELSFCMWEGATTMDVLAVKYITIVYALLLVAVTIMVMKLCTVKCFKLSVKGSTIHGLSAFFVICYAQCTKVTLLVITPARVYRMGFEKVEKVVYYQGDLLYMKGEHLRYAIPAVVFLIVFVLVPLILLLVYPLCYKVFAFLRIEETRFIRLTCRVIPLEKMKPLFDSFQSCFKDNYRFMAGLYFLYRLAVHVTFVLTDSFTKFYVTVEIELIIMLTIQATTYAYKKHWHNILDILLFANLAAINAMTLHNYKRAKEIRKNQSYQREIDIVSGIQTFLIYLPLIYIVWYIITQLLSQRFGRNKEIMEEKSRYDDFTDTLAMVDYRELSNSIREDDKTECNQTQSTYQ